MGMKYPVTRKSRKQERISTDRQNEIYIFSGDFWFFSSLKRTLGIFTICDIRFPKKHTPVSPLKRGHNKVFWKYPQDD